MLRAAPPAALEPPGSSPRATPAKRWTRFPQVDLGRCVRIMTTARERMPADLMFFESFR